MIFVFHSQYYSSVFRAFKNLKAFDDIYEYLRATKSRDGIFSWFLFYSLYMEKARWFHLISVLFDGRHVKAFCTELLMELCSRDVNDVFRNSI